MYCTPVNTINENDCLNSKRKKTECKCCCESKNIPEWVLSDAGNETVNNDIIFLSIFVLYYICFGW